MAADKISAWAAGVAYRYLALAAPLAPLALDHRPQIEVVDVEVAWAVGAAAEWEGHLRHCDQHAAAEAAPSPRLRL